jgi:hypothetical protein
MTEVKRKRQSMGGMFRVKLRELLINHPAGMTLKQISKHVPGKGHSLYRALKRMPDVYISHWVEPYGEKQQAVFVAVRIPDDCPRPPATRQTADQRREYQRLYRLRKAGKEAPTEVKRRAPKPKAATVKGMTAEEAAARDKAMHDRYSNPPTYKELK